MMVSGAVYFILVLLVPTAYGFRSQSWASSHRHHRGDRRLQRLAQQASSNDAGDTPQQPESFRKTTRPPPADDFNVWQELLVLATIEELQTILSNIVQENIECVKYATLALQQGEEAARSKRRPLFNLNETDSNAIFLAFNKLDLLVTNLALDKVRSRYTMEGRLAAREYLDAFVRKIDSSQTLQRLLSQSPNARTSEAAAARHRRNSADHHVPGSPRHLIERLMFEGLRAEISSPSSSSSLPPAQQQQQQQQQRQQQQQQQHEEGAGDGGQFPSATPGPTIGGGLDVLAIAQDVVDERASLCVVFASKVADVATLGLESVREKAYFLSQTRGEGRFLVLDTTGVPMDTGRTRDVQLRFAAPAFLSPALSIAVGPTTANASAGGANALGIDADQPDPSPRSPPAPAPAPAPAASSSSASSPRGPDAVSRALGDLLGSIFGGFGDRDGSRRIKGRDGEASAAPAATSTPDASRDAAAAAAVAAAAPEPESASTSVSGPVPVLLDEQDGGDVPSFLRLGPGASVRLLGQKEENGLKYLLLEGKSVPADGRIKVLRQWISYDDAVTFLGVGFSGQLWEKGEGGGDRDDEMEEGGNSPFYGGEVKMM